MAKKNSSAEGVVYSTDPDFAYLINIPTAPSTLPPGAQNLRLQFEKRNGKPTTVVQGFVGTPDDLEALSKKLKNVSGTGGSAKDGIVLIQGDVREKLRVWFLKEGYSRVK